MAEIIKAYKETLPALRLIGKRYTNADRVNGSYAHIWGEWFAKGWFDTLENLAGAENIENGYIGFMRCNVCDIENTFEYWIGVFLPADTIVPNGFEFLDLEQGDVGVCWIKGKEDDGSIYNMHDWCVIELREKGMNALKTDEQDRIYFFERYNCPRFTEKDSDGNVILDYGIYII